MKTNIKPIATILVISALLSLVVCPLNAVNSLSFVVLARSLCYFAFTWYMLNRNEKENKINTATIVLAICVGSILLEVPVRLMDFRETLPSIPIPVGECIAIVLARYCYKEKRPVVYALTIIVVLLLCIFGVNTWDAFCSR